MPAKALEARFLSSPFPSLRLWGAVSPEALVTGSLAPANDWLPAVPVPAGTQGWQVLSKLHLNPQCSMGAVVAGTPPPGSPPPTPALRVSSLAWSPSCP